MLRTGERGKCHGQLPRGTDADGRMRYPPGHQICQPEASQPTMRLTFPKVKIDIGDRVRHWYELGDERSRIPAMAGMRGLAVLLVFYTHAHDNLGFLLQSGSSAQRVSHFIGQIGHTGVDIFFLLSGYLIYAAAIKPSLNLRVFWLRRAQRIYPAFLSVFLLYAFLSYLMPSISKFPRELTELTSLLAGNLLLLAGLYPIEPIVTVTWSLSFEAFYYLVIPLLIVLTGMRAWPRKLRILFFLILAVLFCSLFYGPLYRPGYWTTARLLMFVAGIMLFEHLSSKPSLPKEPKRKGMDIAVASVFIGAFPIYFWLQEQGMEVDSTVQKASIVLAKVAVLACSTYMLAAHCFTGAGNLRKFFEIAPLRWLGNMSYSYYLIHAVAVHATAQAIRASNLEGAHSLLMFVAAALTAFALSIVFATILFKTIERPYSLDFKVA